MLKFLIWELLYMHCQPYGLYLAELSSIYLMVIKNAYVHIEEIHLNVT